MQTKFAHPSLRTPAFYYLQTNQTLFIAIERPKQGMQPKIENQFLFFENHVKTPKKVFISLQ